MPRYGRNHQRISKVVVTRKRHICEICGLTILKDSKTVAKNPRFLGKGKKYEHYPLCPEINKIYESGETPELITIFLSQARVLNSRGHRIVYDENYNAI